jgi:hypothetical protein
MFDRERFLRFKGYNTSFKATGDWDLYLRIARNSPVFNYDDLIAEYRRHPDQMTCDSAMMLRECLHLLRSQSEFIDKNDALLRKALDSGIRLIQEFYGEPLAEQIRQNMHKRKWIDALRGVVVLITNHPAGFAKHFLPPWIYTRVSAGNTPR